MKRRYSVRILTALMLGCAFALGTQAKGLHLTVHYDYMVLPDQGTACSVRADCNRGQACVANICRGHSHKPDPLAIGAVVEAFAAQGIRLEIDPVPRAIPEREVVTLPELAFPACAGDDAVTLETLRNETGRTHDPHAHYAVFGHRAICPDAAHCLACGVGHDPSSSGFAELPGKSFAVTFGGWVDAGEQVLLEAQAGTLMHELGHNLGLHHGGNADDEYNYKPNYISVMNYAYQLGGINFTETPGSTNYKLCDTHADCRPTGYCADTVDVLGGGICTRIDYSRRELPALNESTFGNSDGLDENVGVSGDPTDTDIVLYFVPGPTQLPGPSFGAIDWNGDGIRTGTRVTADINNDGIDTLLRGHDDWRFIRGVLAAGGIPPWARGRVVHDTDASLPPRRAR